MPSTGLCAAAGITCQARERDRANIWGLSFAVTGQRDTDHTTSNQTTASARGLASPPTRIYKHDHPRLSALASLFSTSYFSALARDGGTKSAQRRN